MTTIQLQFVARKGMEFDESQRKFLEEVSKSAQAQLNSNAFERGVIFFKHKTGRRWHKGYKLNKGKTTHEIFTLLMSGKDPFDSEDKILNIHLNPYYKKSVGKHARTFSRRRSIGINVTYLNYCRDKASDGDARMSGTLLHEYIHLLGFRHFTQKGKPKDMPTVPWGIGNLMRKLVKES